MAPQPLLIRQFTLSKSHLAALTDAERNLFFLSGHILNELNSLNKVFAWSLRSEDSNESDIISLTQGIQSMIYARILAGKLWEAWEALRATWFSSKPSTTLENGLHPDSRIALSALKGYFSHSNLIFDVRNSFAFHYSRKLGERWEEVADENNLQVILGGTIGNNINLAAELITNAAIIRAAHPTDPEAGLQAFLNDVQTMSEHFTTFLEGVTLFYLEEMLGDSLTEQGRDIEIKVTQPFSEVRIPYFCAPDKISSP
ncbi:MAG: hypothetical protein A2063_04280 [Gallionellales bacterium GWA2_60_142]|nr:MAG: hypothetical protein A2063_04280 [Gallionellales bacterium GWA2_60_142]HCI13269.1 hypothetical protein [Gallionellaceae bacterium]